MLVQLKTYEVRFASNKYSLGRSQTNIVWGDPSANLSLAGQAIDRNPGADLYVFPEMFTTGFATQSEALVESFPSETLEWMKRYATAKDCAIAGSIALDLGRICVNRFYFVKPGGDFTFYDKHHLFTMGAEGERYCPGDEQVTVEWRGVRFRLAVCYDLRFPVWLRNKGDYDALIVTASWPDVRSGIWDTLLRARAIENQCYVLGVNRVGSDPLCSYKGGTAFINPYGNVEAEAEPFKECEISGEIDIPSLIEFRSKFPVLEDADQFEMY